MSYVALMMILAAFTYSDIKYFLLPNVLMFSAMFFGCAITGFYIPCAVAFISVALICEHGKVIRWQGGDVKLIAMVAAFIGWLFIPVAILTHLFVNLYRRVRNCNVGLPLAPFVSVATLIVLLSAATLKFIVN